MTHELTPIPPMSLTSDDRNMAVIAHLCAFGAWILPFGNIVGPLAIYLWKKDESDFIREAALESLNFNISLYIWMSLSAFISFFCIGYVTGLALVLISFLLPILAAVEAAKGVHYRYPLTLRLVT